MMHLCVSFCIRAESQTSKTQCFQKNTKNVNVETTDKLVNVLQPEVRE